jgi:hypothetical protein
MPGPRTKIKKRTTLIVIYTDRFNMLSCAHIKQYNYFIHERLS